MEGRAEEGKIKGGRGIEGTIIRKEEVHVCISSKGLCGGGNVWRRECVEEGMCGGECVEE